MTAAFLLAEHFFQALAALFFTVGLVVCIRRGLSLLLRPEKTCRTLLVTLIPPAANAEHQLASLSCRQALAGETLPIVAVLPGEQPQRADALKQSGAGGMKTVVLADGALYARLSAAADKTHDRK